MSSTNSNIMENISLPFSIGDHLSVKGDNISMSSTKVVYESAHREERNSVYCQSPYATTRVSLYFQENPALNANSSAMNHSENSYDMPLLKVRFGERKRKKMRSLV